MALSREQRSQRARIGAYTLHARNDSKAVTAPARKGFLDKFRAEVIAADPDHELSEAEVERRAHALLKAHMNRLALLSSKARMKKKSEAELAEADAIIAEADAEGVL